MFFSLFRSVYSLAESISLSNQYTVKAFAHSAPNTVHYVLVELFEVTPTALKPITDASLTTRLKITHESDVNGKHPILDDTRKSFKDSKNDFFFIAPKKGQFTFSITIGGSSLLKYKNISVDYKIFTGEHNRPSIVSSNDVEVNKAEILISSILEYAKNNLVTQEVEFQDEKVPVNIYSGIIKYAVVMVILKILATLGTAYYSNLQTKRFFATQKLNK